MLQRACPLQSSERKDKRSAVPPDDPEIPLEPPVWAALKKSWRQKFGGAIVRIVVRLRGRSDPKQAACPSSLPLAPSGIHNPSFPDDDLLREDYLSVAQQLRPSLSPICNWLEGDDVRILGRQCISAGGFADLWRGSLDDRQVAIKSYRYYLLFDISRVFLRFSREALVCSRLSHRNIVSFIGIYSTANNPFSLVFNFSGHLDLRQYLNTHPMARRLELLAGVARGLDHMHDLDIVHGCLKMENILVDLDGTARIAGLGSAFILDHTTARPEMCVGWPFQGIAPELMHPEEPGSSHPRNSKASDIYAFSVLAWEVYTGHAIQKGARPPRPDHPEVSDRLWGMMESCWESVPSKRTTTREIVRTLEAEHMAGSCGAP